MPRPRLLFYAAVCALFALPPASSSAHPATRVAVAGDGRVFVIESGFTPPNVFSGPRVRELSPDGTLKVLAAVGLKENVAARLTSPQEAEAEGVAVAECEQNVWLVERALGLYFGLGLVAIGAVGWRKRFARRVDHA